MITKEDSKNEIEKLDDRYLDLIFRLLQHYHIKKNKPDLLACSRPIHYPDDEISDGTVFSDIENAAEYDKY
jgi:hypothetical protein